MTDEEQLPVGIIAIDSEGRYQSGDDNALTEGPDDDDNQSTEDLTGLTGLQLQPTAGLRGLAHSWYEAATPQKEESRKGFVRTASVYGRGGLPSAKDECPIADYRPARNVWAAAGAAILIGSYLLLVVLFFGEYSDSIASCGAWSRSQTLTNVTNSDTHVYSLDSIFPSFGLAMTGVLVGAVLLSIVWLACLRQCAKFVMYFILIALVLLLLALAVQAFIAGAHISGVLNCVIGAGMFTTMLCFRQHLHVVSKTIREAVTTLFGVPSALICATVFSAASLAYAGVTGFLIFFTAAVDRVQHLPDGSVVCTPPPLWTRFACVYFCFMLFWGYSFIMWIARTALAGAAAISYFEGSGAAFLRPLRDPLKWATTSSVGSSAVGCTLCMLPVRLLSCCGCCFCCCGAFAPPEALLADHSWQPDTFETDKELNWGRQYSAQGPVGLFTELDWIRTLYLLPQMVQAYIAITGQDIIRAAGTVHRMLRLRQLWKMALLTMRMSSIVFVAYQIVLAVGIAAVTVLVVSLLGYDILPALFTGVLAGTLTAAVCTFTANMCLTVTASVIVCYAMDQYSWKGDDVQTNAPQQDHHWADVEPLLALREQTAQERRISLAL